VASIGVAVKRWVTLHGFALNVSTDLAQFAAINPCGLEANVMASMSSLLERPISLSEVKPVVEQKMGEIFGRAFA
jgi:lipoate-protein ligase B